MMVQSGLARSTSISCTPGMLGPLTVKANLGAEVEGDWEGMVGSSDVGLGTSRSDVWLILVLPGLGSKAGIRAENFLLST